MKSFCFIHVFWLREKADPVFLLLWHFKSSLYSQILSGASQEDLVKAQLCFTVLLFVKIIEADFV